MNDVLPKPFTKEGLLSMLEKHLSHLKKTPHGMDPMAAPPPPQLASAKPSMKSEDSPVTSPAAVSNWNSPNNFTGVSPVSNNAEDPHMYAVHNSAAQSHYPVQPGMQHGAPMYNTSPGGPMGAPPQQHRRVISDISGGPVEMGDAKRPMYVGQRMPQPRPPQR